MSKWLLFGVVVALPLWSGEREAPPPITLYFEFQHEPSAEVREAIQQEVDVIMAPMGSEFQWRPLRSVSGSEVSVELAVVKFQGRCESTGSLAQHTLKSVALGWTHVSDGAILPFSDIDCDEIRTFIQFGLLSVDPKERAGDFGRAVGRVLAHELYHIFANTAHHGSNGVGKAVYSVRDLLSPDFRFEEHESEALRLSRPHPLVESVDSTH